MFKQQSMASMSSMSSTWFIRPQGNQAPTVVLLFRSVEEASMLGTMMDYPLTLHSILERIPSFYSTVEIVSRLPDASIHRYTYGDFYRRAMALAEALQVSG